MITEAVFVTFGTWLDMNKSNYIVQAIIINIFLQTEDIQNIVDCINIILCSKHWQILQIIPVSCVCLFSVLYRYS